VLGGGANICYEYATKRYRSNCINWGIIPFTIDRDNAFSYDETPSYSCRHSRCDPFRQNGIPAKVIGPGFTEDITLHLTGLTENEKTILLDGCLMNFYAPAMPEIKRLPAAAQSNE
jgi:aconitate hydratase